MDGNRQDTHGEHDIHLPDLERPEFRHETTDVDTWAVGKFAIALVLVSILSLAGLFGLFRYFQQRDGGILPRATTREMDARKRPPLPQLEETPQLDLAREKAAEEQILNNYGWADRQNGVVRIPIDRAMDLIAQRGLPVRQQAPAADSATVPTASGMGPIMQRPGGPLAGESK
jgi:hypothetical protein